MVSLFQQERRLGLLHFGRDVLQPLRVGPALEQTHGSRIARKRAIGERVNQKERKSHKSP